MKLLLFSSSIFLGIAFSSILSLMLIELNYGIGPFLILGACNILFFISGVSISLLSDKR